MSSSSDPLSVLRSVLSSDPSSRITYLDASSSPTTSLSSATQLVLPSSPPTTFSKAIPTRFTCASTTTTTYDLATLVFAWLSREQGVGEYLKNARDEQVGFVAITDRRIVLDYLAGKVGGGEAGGRILKEGSGGQDVVVVAEEGKTSGEATTTAASATTSASTTTRPTLPTSSTTTTTTTQDNRPLKRPAYQTDQQDFERVKRLMQIVQGPVYANIAPDNSSLEPTGFAIKNRETVLRGERTNNFESVLTLLAPRLKLIKDNHFEARPSASTSTSTTPAPGTTSSSSGKNRRKALNPIIMLSPSETALLNLYNIKAFLERAQYVEPSKAKLDAGGEETDMVIVHHARASSTIASSVESRNGWTNDPNAALRGGAGGARYFVVNSVEALAKFGSLDDAWDRVVCVMTTGQEWQFRPYKWREPKELFHHVKGVFVQYTHEAPNPKVRSWNVTELRVDRKNRHIDKSTVADFWRSLDAWIAMYKPHLHV
ncbi:BZ3500_MvSof-1268-A1-R1_Chr3-3g06387 [Microbotryum saponariae]|uniref:BZ3500_MvSof-1268-A1-R1_Chr3-3g06387 protein n=1 Tax=Microbotryum saponariae TaxID=289078 RepID=A0A2X0KV07_9BASI|nr:BZ3500_MvSof-1268-A1-R1_Chr3-3g06387 [Microbotryum saponariae]